VTDGEHAVVGLADDQVDAGTALVLDANRGAPLVHDRIARAAVSLVLPDPSHAALDLFADPSYAFLLQVPVLAWNELKPHEDAEVLASFVDALGRTTPAIVRGSLARGTVILFGTSADDSWSLLPRNPPTWLPLVHELVDGLVAPDPAGTNVPVGQAPSLVVTGRPTQARLELPSGAMREIGRPEVEALGARSLLSLQASPLTEPGPWTLAVEYADSARPTSRIALAALPDAREGDLRRLDGATLERRLAGVDFVLGEAAEGSSSDGRSEAGDGSLFRFLLWALFGAVVGESVLSRLVGRRR